MAFPEKMVEQKFQIRLSPLAQEVLSDDMFTYQEEKLGLFLNRVFISYHTDAAASISIQVQKLRLVLRDERLPEDTICTLCNRLSKESLTIASTYPVTFPNRFYLQNNVMEHLPDESAPLDGYPCRKGQFYPRISIL